MQYSTIKEDHNVTVFKFCPRGSNKTYTIENSTVRIGRAKRLYILHSNQIDHLADVLNHFSTNNFNGDIDNHLKQIIKRLEAEYTLFRIKK